jgi:hypothetical protein
MRVKSMIDWADTILISLYRWVFTGPAQLMLYLGKKVDCITSMLHSNKCQ